MVQFSRKASFTILQQNILKKNYDFFRLISSSTICNLKIFFASLKENIRLLYSTMYLYLYIFFFA